MDKNVVGREIVDASSTSGFISSLGGRKRKTVLIEIRIGDRARISATEGTCVTDMLLGSDAFVSVSQTDTRVN